MNGYAMGGIECDEKELVEGDGIGWDGMGWARVSCYGIELGRSGKRRDGAGIGWGG